MQMNSDFKPDIYAIDFGTSNSLLAAANRDDVHSAIPLEPNAPDPTLLRSILFFPDKDRSTVQVGRSALEQYVAEGFEGRLVRSAKRFLPAKAFQRTHINGQAFTLEQIIAILLREMKQRADAYFGASVKRVLLGRPARFSNRADEDDYAEKRLRRAAHLAGFEQIHFCPEPIGAARDFEASLTEPKTVLVGDFGGGTSDFSLVRLSQTKLARAGFGEGDILATHGVATAGDALDGALMRHKVARHFGADVRYKVPFGSNELTMPTLLMSKLCSPAEMSFLQQRDVRAFLEDVRGWSLGDGDRQAMDRLFCLIEDALGFQLFEALERSKQRLSDHENDEFAFEVPGISVRQAVTRNEFEVGAKWPLRAIVEAMDLTLQQSGVSPDDVDLVCLTGGTARVPAIRAALAGRFGIAKLHHLRGLHAVVSGLAYQARRTLQLNHP